MTLSVVVPALDEEEAIGHVIEKIRSMFESAGWSDAEVVVVDDGSKDKTSDVARDFGAKVVRHPHNIGYGFALKSGIKAASYDTIAITDADGTYPVDRIPDLHAKMQEGYDMVVGQRTGAEYRESALKSPLRSLLRFLVEFTAERRIPDINSGLRVFNRQAALEYSDQLCDTFSFTTSLTLAYMMSKKFVCYEPIDYYKRIGSTKVRLFSDSLRTLQYILQAALYFNPLKIFFLASVLILIGAMVSFALSFTLQIKTAFFLGVGGFLTAVLVFCFGLIADLLKQIMHHNRKNNLN